MLLAFGFKNFGGDGDLQMVLCHSINEASVVGLPSSGGDTQTLPHAEEFELFEPTGGGDAKLWAQVLVPGLERSYPRANIVELSQHVIFFMCSISKSKMSPCTPCRNIKRF